MGIADKPVIGTGTPTAAIEQARIYVRTAPNRVLTGDEASQIAAAFWDIGPTVGIDPAIAFAMACHETNIFRYTGDVKVAQKNIGGIGTTGGGVPGVSNGTWRKAVEVFFWHLLAWTGDTLLGAGTPRYTLVRAAIKAKGAATTWASLGGRWAVPGTGYGAAIERHYAAILATAGGTMTVTDYPSPNFGYPQGEHGRSGNKVIALVLHIMDGSLTGTRSWFASTASQASANRGLGRDGVSMDRYVKDSDAPWTNGDIQGPDLSIAWLRDAIARGVNPNELTETLECEGHSGEPWPEPQYQGILQWVKDRTSALGIVPTKDTVVGHYRLNSVTRANCPGKNFPWDRLFHDLGVGFNLPDAGKSLMLKAAWAKGRQVNGDAGLPDPYGLMQYEAVADLSGIVATLPKTARCLVCEKAVLWIGGAGAIDTMHRGQYEALEASGKAQKLV
jgi:N-acetylmuramoyl-L-alanine amidase